ncbi:MAG: hypothetical protein D3925_05100 [Candidatus Electrothrix sp. AR5]|nr:hypothetical protein [Candidatus Electrothrix sp. AR5]
MPGWDEVGLLLLTIHAGQGAQTEPTAHLELLAELNPTDEAQAKLLMSGLTGKELDYSEEDLARWLPVAAAIVLIHPPPELPNPFGIASTWTNDELGLNLLKKLFSAEDQVNGLWNILVDAVKKGSWDTRDQSDLVKVMDDGMRKAWRSLHKQDREAAFEALMLLAVESNWIEADSERPKWNPITDKELEQIIADWVKKQNPILYQRDDNFLPEPSSTRWWLESVVPDQGILWQTYLMRTPLDYCLRGQFEGSSPSLLFSVYPYESLPINIRLALGLYQCQNLLDSFTFGKYTYLFNESQQWIPSISQWPRLRSISRMQSIRIQRSEARLTARWPLHAPLKHRGIIIKSHVAKLAKEEHLSYHLRKILKYVGKLKHQISDQTAKELEKFGYRYSAYDWFLEQAESPDLMQRRGLRPGQPLPPKLELFDDKGLLRSPLKRQAIVNLHNWLQDDQQILLVFPGRVKRRMA